ncbi:MAG: hypothetical protein ACK5MD_07695 [Flavobacteriales bacterium]
MKKNYFRYVIYISIHLSFLLSNAQVGIGTDTPNVHSNLDIDSKDGTKGVMLPKITNTQKATLISSLGADDEGLSFYNVDSDCIITWKGTEFSEVCEQGKAVFETTCTTSTVNGTYREGYTLTSAEQIILVINVTKEGPYDISATAGNGYYFSASGYLTTGNQNLVLTGYGTPTSEGTDQVVVRDNLNSSDLCTFDIAVGSGDGQIEISPTQCSNINAPNMIVGSNTSVEVQVEVNVLRTGPVTLKTDTNNGVTFEGYKYFTTTGPNTIVLSSNGTVPASIGTFTYTIEGISCTFDITVVPNTATINAGPTSITPNGTYIETIDLSSTQSITANGITFSTAGSYNLGIRYKSGGSADPGLTFQNQSGTITTAPTTQNFTFPATIGTTASKAGTYVYEVYDVYTGDAAPGLTVSIIVEPLIGSFDNPAPSCQAIFEEYNTSTNLILNDGEYWIDGTGGKYKTRCDMVSSSEASSQGKTVGGYTLVWSYSEKTNLTTFNHGGTDEFSQLLDRLEWNSTYSDIQPRNLVEIESGTMNYYDFRIRQVEATRLSNRVTRIRIAEDAKKSDTDTYGNNYYMETTGSVNWLSGGENFSGATGGAFGRYKGETLSLTGGSGPCGLTLAIGSSSDRSVCIYGNDGYGWHLDINYYFTSIGESINNMWGFFGELDHDTAPFGKCTNPTSMTLFGHTAPGCNGDTDGARKQHSGINGDEGYVLQWWVK